MKKNLVLLFFIALLASSCMSSNKRCYWKENYTGDYKWVPATQVHVGEELSKRECRTFDSCYGGKGKSGGGCYKWATSPDASGEGWKK